MGRKKRKGRAQKLGLPPGALMHIGEKKVKKVSIELIDYDTQLYESKLLKNPNEAFVYADSPSTTWININGLHDIELLKNLNVHFKLHPLILEDILNTDQRIKVEIYDDYIFVVLKMLTYNEQNNSVMKEQISLVLTKSCVISFQEKPGDVLNPLRERIKNSHGRIRRNGADYLLYTIMDIIIDHYFLVLELLSDQIESLENRVLSGFDINISQEIHFLKQELLLFRKSTLPVRDIIVNIIRDDSSLFQAATLPYLKDLNDHINHVAESIDSMHDRLSSVMDLNLSNVSNRMNEVMKVLTIIATIFIPLSFLAGVYGMNFEYLPEIKWKWGYYAFWGIILFISGSMIYYFHRKKWI
jgi:magnesium transporter